MNPPIVVVSTCHNVGQWAYRCIASVREQDTPSTHLFISDASNDRPDNFGVSWTDRAAERAIKLPKKHPDTRTVHSRIKEVRTQMPIMVDTIHGLPDEAIVVHLDGDDWLLPGALTTVLKTYQDGGDNHNESYVWMTYGQFTHYSGEPGWAAPYPDEVIKQNRFREHGFLMTHLKTWRAGLFKRINVQDFLAPAMSRGAIQDAVYPKKPEDWIQDATDIAIMFPLIEMAGAHHRFIETHLMVYNNTGNPLSAHNVGPARRSFQLSEAQRMLKRRPYQPLTERPW